MATRKPSQKAYFVGAVKQSQDVSFLHCYFPRTLLLVIVQCQDQLFASFIICGSDLLLKKDRLAKFICSFLPKILHRNSPLYTHEVQKRRKNQFFFTNPHSFWFERKKTGSKITGNNLSLVKKYCFYLQEWMSANHLHWVKIHTQGIHY